MSLPIVYMDPVSGNDANDGSILHPVRTIANAFTKVTPGGTLLAAATGSLGALTFSNGAVRISAPAGVTASVGAVIGYDVSFVAENVTFPSGVSFYNTQRSGAVAVRNCRFTGTYGIYTEKVQYVSLHRNLFDLHNDAIGVRECLEASVGDNVVHGSLYPVNFTSTQNLDFFHNTVDNCGQLYFDDFSSGVAFNVSYYTVTPAILAAKQLHVSGVPLSLAVNLLIAQDDGTDYTVSGNTVSWAGLGMEADIGLGDTIRVVYETQGGYGTAGVMRLDSNSLSSNAAGISFSSGDYAQLLYNNLYNTPYSPPGGGDVGNISSDPKYATPGSDFRLQATSPNIGLGDPALWLTTFLMSAQADQNTDYAGIERDYDPSAPVEDSGAYEYKGTTGTRTSPAVHVSASGRDSVGIGDAAQPYRSVGKAASDATTDPIAVHILGTSGVSTRKSVSVESSIAFSATKGLVVSGASGATGVHSRVALRPTPGTPIPTGSVAWVSPYGGDTGAGTAASPYRTISKALSVASTALVLPGHYPGFTGSAGKAVLPMAGSFGSTGATHGATGWYPGVTGAGYRVDEASGRTWTVSDQTGVSVSYFYDTIHVQH